MAAELTDAIKDQAVEMYQAGARLVDITAETGLDRPTIYWILRSRGLRPDRKTPSTREQIAQCQQQVTTLLFVSDLLVERLGGFEDPQATIPATMRMLEKVRQDVAGTSGS